jgi:hypothetical protein
MSLKLIGIVLVSVLGFAQAPSSAPDPGDLWRKIRSALIAPDGDKFFQQIKDAVTPTMFPGQVVSQPSPKTLIVNVDNPAGDATLKFENPLKSIDPGTLVYFNGVVDSYVKVPYMLTLWGHECREGPKSIICEIR